jgi:hypothetical protein
MFARRSLALALVLVFCTALSALASASASEDPISGTWSGAATSGQGGAPLELTLKLDGEAVTGQISTDQGSNDIKDGSWKGGVLAFKTTYNGVPVSMTASLKEGKLVGEFSYNEGEVLGTWSVAREPARQP